MKSEEIWKPIRGFEEYAKVSNYGNIVRYERTVRNGKSQRVIPEKLLKRSVTTDKYGYNYVNIHDNGKKVCLNVAKTVYETFNELDLNNKMCIVYVDGNKNNCRLSNIKIVTRRDLQNRSYNKTGYNGVSKKRGERQYVATIVFEGKRMTVHSSDSKEDCMKIYELAKCLINEYEKNKIKILQNSKLHNKIIQKRNRLK